MMDTEATRLPRPDGTRDAVPGPPLYRRCRADMEMSTSKPNWLERLEREMVQPPVRMGWAERVWRWLLGR